MTAPNVMTSQEALLKAAAHSYLEDAVAHFKVKTALAAVEFHHGMRLTSREVRIATLVAAAALVVPDP